MSIYPDINPTGYSDAGQVRYTAACPSCGLPCTWTARQNEPQPHPHCTRCASIGGSE